MSLLRFLLKAFLIIALVAAIEVSFYLLCSWQTLVIDHLVSAVIGLLLFARYRARPNTLYLSTPRASNFLLASAGVLLILPSVLAEVIALVLLLPSVRSNVEQRL